MHMPLRIRGHIKYPAKQPAPKVEPKRVKIGGSINYWTPREDEVIRAVFLVKGAAALAERFGRASSCVSERARFLGVVT
jgi:hypothetical protein